MARHAAPAPVESPTMWLPVYDPAHTGRVLGGTAVAAGETADAYRDHATHLASIGDRESAQDAWAQSQEHDWQTGEMLDQVRQQIRSDRKRPDLLSSYLDYFIGDQFNEARSTGRTAHTDIVDWLGDAHNGATDGQLYGFLYDHMHYLEAQQQHPEVQEVIAKTREKYMTTIRAAVDADWMSPDALHTLGKVKDAHVVIGDMWDTFMQGRDAYFQDGTTYVVIGQGDRTTWGPNDTLENIRNTLPHELSHLQFDDMRTEPDWFVEGMAEHVNRIVDYGHPEIIDPDERGDDGAYPEYRSFLANIYDGRDPSKGNKQLLAAALRAYTSVAGSPEWEQFMHLFDEEWGKGAFNSFNDTIMAHAKADVAAGKGETASLIKAVAVEDNRLRGIRKYLARQGSGYVGRRRSADRRGKHAASWRHSAKQQRAEQNYTRGHAKH